VPKIATAQMSQLQPHSQPDPPTAYTDGLIFFGVTTWRAMQ
jgi:hypothetical protein